MKSILLPLVCVLTLGCSSSVFAAKDVFVRSKPHCNVGTLGPIFQGKTTLIAALAAASDVPLQSIFLRYTDPAGSGEMKIEARLAEVETTQGQYSVYDFDDEGTVENLLGGAVKQDGAILVVSAADGPMPQTREHVLLARQTGVPAIVVFLNLDGATSQDQIGRAESQVRELISSAGYDGKATPMIQGSASDALRGGAEALLALADLMDALDEIVLRP